MTEPNTRLSQPSLTSDASPAPIGVEPNLDRLWDRLDRAAEVGRWREIGVQRLALTDADRDMRDLFAGWCRDAGLEVSVDQIGNIFARRPGAPVGPPILVGSHLDTQVAGGRYDGVLGVLAGLEVAQSLSEQSVPLSQPVEVVAWTDEEGARFSPPMLGSAVYAGALPLDTALATTDGDGTTVSAELARIGYSGSQPVPGPKPAAYFELHIEQGEELDRAGIDVGVVVGAFSTRGIEARLCGETSHAGATPMSKRRNALVGASRICVAVDELADRYGDPARATTSRLVAWPNRPGIVSSEVMMVIDVRHPDSAVTDRMADELRELIKSVVDHEQLDFDILREWEFGAGVSFDFELADIVRSAARRRNCKTVDLYSSAGHDAYWMATIAPTQIVFVPCIDGITHNEHELIEHHRVARGVQVLADAVATAATRPVPRPL